MTRVGSRYALTACGFFMVVLAFLGKITAALSAVPDAVVGAALMVSMAAGVGVSINVIIRQGPLGSRDYMVVGVPILLGITSALMPEAFLSQLPQILRPLAGNGLIVGVVFVLLLEHVILREKKV